MPRLLQLGFDPFVKVAFDLRRRKLSKRGKEKKDYFFLRGKHIFHNYGHGGSGVSLAPGCARLMTMSFDRLFDRSMVNEVAVIGSGYIGLFTAKFLQEGGANVTLYAD